MMMMVMSATDRFRQILDVGELSALGRIRKVGRELGELVRRCRISVRRRGLRGGLQVRGDLLRYLLVLRRVRLLKLLQRVQQLGEW